ncbi:MAG: winged helix-turn-helix transcriptional regulator [Candidatus Diapherotrites archaeon]|nr:winged helix-turn-helix transcriptional regulator [Candidatus Diapherotrites archaeon]
MKPVESTPYHLCMETLGNELRMEIVRELRKGPKTVQDLSEALHVEQSRLSHSLQSLRECSHVESTPQGKTRVYSLKSDILTQTKDPGENLFVVLDSHAGKFCSQGCCKLK